MGILLTKLKEIETKENRSFQTEESKNQNNDQEILSLLTNNDQILEKEEIEALTTRMEQALGHYSQVIVKVENCFSPKEYQQLLSQKQTYEQQLSAIKNSSDQTMKLTQLKDLEKKWQESYTTMTVKIKKSVANQKLEQELKQEIEKAEDLLLALDSQSTSLSSEWMQKVSNLYQQALDQGKNEQALQTRKHALQLLISELEGKWQELQQNGAKTNQDTFDLFASIKDQITGSTFLNKDEKIYAKYQLQDGRNYYAMIPSAQTLNQALPEFQNLKQLQLTKEEIEKMLLQIIRNAQVYYDLKEYITYLEQIYKKNNATNQLQSLKPYETQILNMEKTLTSQLKFAESLAPVLNGKTSEAFPGIVYQGPKPKDFYGDIINLVPKTKEEWTKVLISQVLGNDQAPIKLTTQDMLHSLYGTEEVENLKMIFQEPSKPVPPITKDEQVSNYLKKRLATLKKLEEEKQIKENFDREEEPAYFDINTVLDLHTAAAVSDQIYQKGQGLFAICELLKTHEVNRFTSQYKARELAMKVNPDHYLTLLLENMIKSFANSVKKSKEDSTYLTKMAPVFQIIQETIAKTDFSKQQLMQAFLTKEEALKAAISNFDYQFLDPLSEENKLLQNALKIGKERQNMSAIKIENALAKVHES